LLDEQVRKRLGQRCHGKILLVAETQRTREAARSDVFDYIERFYNTIRRRSTIGSLSPVEFEKKVGAVNYLSTEPAAGHSSIATTTPSNASSTRSSFEKRDANYLVKLASAKIWTRLHESVA
jgi:Integrase core domain